MTFPKSVLPLGEGRACHARFRDGAAEILCVVSGGVVVKCADTVSREVRTSEVISFADGAVFCGDGILESFSGSLAYAEPDGYRTT